MLYTRRLCSLGCRFIAHWNLGAAIQEKELVNVIQRGLQGFGVGEIALEHFHAIPEL